MWLLVLSVLTAEGPGASVPQGTTVVVTRRAGLTRDEGLVIADEVASRLAEGGAQLALAPRAAAERLAANGISDSASCEGKTACTIDVAKLLGLRVLVSVELGAVRKSMAVHLEAFTSDGSSSVAVEDFVLTRGRAPRLPPLTSFSASVRTSLYAPGAMPLPLPAKDAPTDRPVALVPRVSDTPEATPNSGAPAGTLVAGGVAVATGATAVALGLLANAQRMTVASQSTADGRPLIPLPEGQAQARAAEANRNATLSAVSATGCAVATGLLVWYLLND